jgi:hypothetical protein
MNRKQKFTVWVGLVLIVSMGLYPPWTQRFTYNPNWGLRADTYSWIWGPGAPWVWPSVVPADEEMQKVFMGAVRSAQYWESSLDASRLLLQWVLVCLLVGGLVRALASPKPNVTPAAKRASSDDGKPD